MSNFASRLTTAAHAAFIESLDARESAALRDLLILASLADGMLTVQEREDIANALAELPGLGSTLDFETADLIDHIDALYERHEADGDALLKELLEQLGTDDKTRRHAFRVMASVLASAGVSEAEEAFLRDFAERCSIEAEVVDFAISQGLQ